MPWSIEKRGDQFCVIKDADGENEGCHDSRADAEAQRRALYANEDAASLDIEGLNDRIVAAHDELFALEDGLASIYAGVLQRIGRRNASMFRDEAIAAAAWVAPNPLPDETMTAAEAEEAQKQREDAAELYWLLVLAGLGLTVVAADVLTALANRALDAVSAAGQDLMRQIIEEAAQQGLSITETANSIQTVFTDLAPSTARMIARTELTAIASEADIRAAGELGKRKKKTVYKTWNTQGDSRVRAAHRSAAYQTVPIDQPFTVGGSSLMYPGDPFAPLSLTANCRCFLTFAETITASADAPTLGGTMDNNNGANPTPILPFTTSQANAQGGGIQIEYAPAYRWDYTSGQYVGIWGEQSNGVTAEVPVTASVTITVDEEQKQEDALAPVKWRGVITLEGAGTSDGRYFELGAWSWRELPLPFLAQTVTAEGHLGAEVAGRIDRIWKVPAADIEELAALDLPEGAVAVMGEGEFTNEFGIKTIAPMVNDQTLSGVSVDFSVSESGLRDSETGEIVDPSELDIADILFGGQYQMAALKAEIAMATIVGFPAFAGASISIVAAGGTALHRAVIGRYGWELLRGEALTAAAAGLAPLRPPREWLMLEESDGPTPLTVTEDGQVYGHIALWGTCHIGDPSGAGICVEPPESASGYAYFHQGTIQTAEGDFVPVGKITLDTGHAGLDLNWQRTIAHYDNTGTVAAYVHAVDGRYGIWVSGTARSDAPEETVRNLRAAPASGDWRNINGRLEMVGILAVNVPGFPIPRVAALVTPSLPDHDERVALIAAGMFEQLAVPTVSRSRIEQRRIEALAAEADEPSAA